MTGFSDKIINSGEYTEVPFFYLSPAMTVTDLKEYISSVIEVDDIESMIIWSTVTNIEYSHHHKIFNPKMSSIEEFNHNTIIPDSSIFEEGPIYITGNFSRVRFIDRSDDDFFYRLYKAAQSVTYKIDTEYIDIFRSSFKITDFDLIKKVVMPQYQVTLFVKMNQDILVSGHLIPLVIPEGYFTIIVSNEQDVILEITESKIVTHSFEYFEQFIIKMMQLSSDIVIPERFYNSVKYNISSVKRVNNRFSEYENISLFFLQPQAWDSDNILQTKDKKMSIFLSTQGLKIRSNEPLPFFVSHISRLLLAYAELHPKEDVLKFDKINGVYWSRICQNTKDDIRKPIKRIDQQTVTNSLSQVMIDGVVFECINDAKNKFIGFLNKPYELSSICLPCCYQSSQIERPIFKKCTEESTSISSDGKEIFSLFIIDENRLLNNNRLGFLEEVVDGYLNLGNDIVLKNKMLISCKNFFLISGNNSSSVDFSIDYMIKFLMANPQVVIIHNRTFYVSKYLDASKPISYRVIVKNFFYKVIKASKKEKEDIIVIEYDYSIHPDIKIRNETLNKKKILYIDNILRVPIIKSSDNKIIKEGSVNTVAMTQSYLESLGKMR